MEEIGQGEAGRKRGSHPDSGEATGDSESNQLNGGHGRVESTLALHSQIETTQLLHSQGSLIHSAAHPSTPAYGQNSRNILPVQHHRSRLSGRKHYASSDEQRRDQRVRPRFQEDAANRGVIECCSELCHSAHQSAARR